MKTQNLKKIVFLVFVSFLLISCFKDNETPLEVNVDAYTVKKLIGEQSAYGVAFFAYGNQIMKSGTVTQVGGLGEQINLGLNASSIFTLSKEPAVDDFKSIIPVASEYIFNVSAESGATHQGSDYLDPKNIGIPVILKVEFNEIQKLLDVTWMKITVADGYFVKIAEEGGAYIYTSGAVETDITTLSINLLIGNWTKPMEPGNTYTIEVNAFAIEDTADEYTAAYNIEEISISSKSFYWE